MKTIVLSRPAEKQLSALPGEVAADIADALHLYAMLGRGDVKALQGPASDFASDAIACYSWKTRPP